MIQLIGRTRQLMRSSETPFWGYMPNMQAGVVKHVSTQRSNVRSDNVAEHLNRFIAPAVPWTLSACTRWYP
jgi:hypothetical protein